VTTPGVSADEAPVPVTEIPADNAGVLDVEAVNLAGEARRLCLLGYHAWMPWIERRRDDGLLLAYDTFCVRCRRAEAFDV
jgi:hypothetical protein